MSEGTCHFCGGDTPCDCTATCKHCPHIGHEHSLTGLCRGTNYDTFPFKEEPCHNHIFEPQEVTQ